MKIGLYSISCSGTWFRDRPALTVEEFVDTAKNTAIRALNWI